MDWLQHDELAPVLLPDWAQSEGPWLDGRPYRVKMLSEGLVLERHGSVSAVPWQDVLAPVRLDEPRRLLLAAARRPPRPPWFQLAGDDVATIDEVVRARLAAMEAGSYRARRPVRDVVSPDEILTRVLAHHPVPGGVEIPAAGQSVLIGALKGATLGGAFFGLYGLAFGLPGLVTAGAVGMLGGAGIFGGVEHWRNRKAGRVLVLTPDAFVGGLDGHSVRAISWPFVGRFGEGVDESGESALEVSNSTGEIVVRVSARYFGQPLDVIVAVAEAYRRRALEGLA